MPLGILQGRRPRRDRQGRRPGANTLLRAERGEDVRRDAGGLPGRRRVGHHARTCCRSSSRCTLGNFAIWTPPTQGFAQAPGGFLFGKPITFSQTARPSARRATSTSSTSKAYRTISKDGVQIASRCTSTSTPTRRPSARRSASTASRRSSADRAGARRAEPVAVRDARRPANHSTEDERPCTPNADSHPSLACSPRSTRCRRRGTVTTGWVDDGQVQRSGADLQTGVLGAAATVDAKLQQATSAAGAGAKDIAGKAITQIVKATGDNKQVADRPARPTSST
jgi:hypothetical protein